MKNKITTFLTFQGQAEEAMQFYISLFEDSSITSMQKYGPDGPGKDGSVYQATFELNGQEYICIDSPVLQDFSFNPAISMYVACESEEEIEQLYASLAQEGKTFMELNNYGFSKKFGWVEDQFGVSWQLNLA